MSTPQYAANAHEVFDNLVKAAMEYFGQQNNIIMTELEDAVVLENNNDKLLANGYGIEWGDDRNAGTMLSEETEILQTVEVVFTTSNYGSVADTEIRKQSERLLLRMKDMLMSYVAANPQLDDNVAKCIYEGSSRFEYIFTGEDNTSFAYLSKRSTFTFGYFEHASTLT